MKQAHVPVEVTVISAGKFRRYQHLSFWQHFSVPHVVIKNVTDLGKIFAGFVQSFWILLRRRPDIVFAKGGYVCLPMGVAAWMLRIPLVIHDSDTRPGLTNRVLSRFAAKIGTGAALENYSYDRDKTTYVGVPISPEFKPVTLESQAKFKQQLGIDPAQKLVVATGGGLGSPLINAALVSAAPELHASGIAVYNITGKSHYDAVKKSTAGLKNYRAVAFVYDHMDRVLGAADVVVARGSATFLQELAGLKKAVIVVPAKQLGDQIKNAAVYEAANAAVVLTDDQIEGSDRLESAIVELFNDDSRRHSLAESLHKFARPNAAADMARIIVDAVK